MQNGLRLMRQFTRLYGLRASTHAPCRPQERAAGQFPFQLVDPGGTGAVIRQAKLRLQLPPRQAVRVPGKLALDAVSELVVGHGGAKKRERFAPPSECVAASR